MFTTQWEDLEDFIDLHNPMGFKLAFVNLQLSGFF